MSNYEASDKLKEKISLLLGAPQQLMQEAAEELVNYLAADLDKDAISFAVRHAAIYIKINGLTTGLDYFVWWASGHLTYPEFYAASYPDDDQYNSPRFGINQYKVKED